MKTSHRYCGNARGPVSQRTVSPVSCCTEFSGDRQSASQTHPFSHGMISRTSSSYVTLYRDAHKVPFANKRIAWCSAKNSIVRSSPEFRALKTLRRPRIWLSAGGHRRLCLKRNRCRIVYMNIQMRFLDTSSGICHLSQYFFHSQRPYPLSWLSSSPDRKSVV